MMRDSNEDYEQSKISTKSKSNSKSENEPECWIRTNISREKYPGKLVNGKCVPLYPISY